MTPERPTDETLRTLLDAACSDVLTDEQFEHLEASLSASEDARREYLRYFTLTGELRYLLSMAQADAAARERTGMEYAAGDHLADKPRIPSRETSPGVPFPAWIFRGMADGLSREWTRAYLSAAVILGLFLLVASFIYVPHTAPIDRAGQLAENAPRMPTVEFVGRITGMVDVKWSDDPHYLPPPDFAHVPLGRKYILDAGLLEITYDSGAKVILEGPCTYEVESTAGGYLALGKLTARVGEDKETKRQGDKGKKADAASPHLLVSQSPGLPVSPLFSVRTPTALVTDLGTEFGVEVDKSGGSKTHVFQGKVEVRLTGNGADARAIQLGVGESARVQPDKDAGDRLIIVRGTADAAGFVRVGQLAKLAEQLHPTPLRRWQAWSKELRNRDDLLAYYDFQRDKSDRSVLRNRAATGAALDGRIESPAWVSGRFPGKHALRFGWPGNGVRVNIPVECKQLTLAAWVKLDSLPGSPKYGDGYGGLLMSDGWNRVASGGTDFAGRIAWQIRHDGRAGFTLDNWNGSTHSPPVFDNAETLGRWRHLAVVYVHGPETSRAAFYLNGEHVGSEDITAAASPTMAANSRGLTAPGAKLGPAMIGAWWDSRDADRTSAGRPLGGRIDELMIFRSALDAEEIHRIYESTKPQTLSDATSGKEVER